MLNIFNKYEIIEEIKDSKIKTYLTRSIPTEKLIKEIHIKDINQYYLIRENFTKEENINEIVIEDDIIFLVIDNNKEINHKVDEFLTKILSDDSYIENERII